MNSNSIKGAIGYYSRLYKRFGFKAVSFLIKSKFKRNKTGPIYLRGIKFPITLSNFECDVTTLFQIFYAKEYEVKKRINPKVIIDCGANIGLSAVWFTNIYPNCKIIAIEPDPNNFKFLEENTRKYKNITILNKAIWSVETNISLIDKKTGGWSLQTMKSSTEAENSVKCLSISGLMDEFKIDFIDILKIDIEGAEKELFSKNYEYWLLKTGIIAIELHENIDKDIPDIFYNAISGRKYSSMENGENLICYFDKD